MNLVKNNQSIATEALQNEGRVVENLTNNYDNDCKRGMREGVQCTTLSLATEQAKSAILANKIAAIVHSAATPSPFLRVAYAIRRELARMPNEVPLPQGPQAELP